MRLISSNMNNMEASNDRDELEQGSTVSTEAKTPMTSLASKSRRMRMRNELNQPVLSGRSNNDEFEGDSSPLSAKTDKREIRRLRQIKTNASNERKMASSLQPPPSSSSSAYTGGSISQQQQRRDSNDQEKGQPARLSPSRAAMLHTKVRKSRNKSRGKSLQQAPTTPVPSTPSTNAEDSPCPMDESLPQDISPNELSMARVESRMKRRQQRANANAAANNRSRQSPVTIPSIPPAPVSPTVDSDDNATQFNSVTDSPTTTNQRHHEAPRVREILTGMSYNRGGWAGRNGGGASGSETGQRDVPPLPTFQSSEDHRRLNKNPGIALRVTGSSSSYDSENDNSTRISYGNNGLQDGWNDAPPRNTIARKQAQHFSRVDDGQRNRSVDNYFTMGGNSSASGNLDNSKKGAYVNGDSDDISATGGKSKQQCSAEGVGGPSLINGEDVDYFRQNMDTPIAKTAVGVVAAATVGVVLLGPIGVLIGAASVGIGVGVMQIPEEQRGDLQKRAAAAVEKAQESAQSVTEVMTKGCVSVCHQTGVDEIVPVEQCFPVKDSRNSPATVWRNNSDDSAGTDGVSKRDNGIVLSPSGADVAGGPSLNLNQDSATPRTNARKIACLRRGRITPITQIHSLAPKDQPKAWVEIMASANTTRDEKMEALEEILILAKDKNHALIFLEEGILDSLMYILGKYFDKFQFEDQNLTKEDASLAKLAASCAVALGKAHCAVVHTGGDLRLMSLYDRGSVPEERQLAQMLFEVPHHVCSVENGKEVFSLQQSDMKQAEDLGRAIAALAEWKM